MSRLFPSLCAMLCLTLLVAGCGGGAKYRPLSPTPQSPTIPARAVVTDFRDDREFVVQMASVSRAWPFTWRKGYRISRPDEAFAGSTESFSQSVPRLLAESLAEARAFESVSYHPANELPPRGEYDVLIRGTLRDTTAYGNTYYYSLVLPFGFHFADVPWFFGAPKLWRKYSIAFDVEVLDGYRDERLVDPIRVQYRTSSKAFTTYAAENRFNDLNLKVNAAFNDYLLKQRAALPNGGNTEFWASLRTAGQEHLASLAREQERIRLGAPPVFSFLSPTEGSVVRSPQAQVTWSLVAPNGLRTVGVAVNNELVDIGVSAFGFDDEANAPRSLPSREVAVPLRLGANKLEARVTDHRGNATTAELTLNRLPVELSPVGRHALLIGVGGNAAHRAVDELQAVLTDPNRGQMAAATVTATKVAAISETDLHDAIRAFGARPRAGELAVVYVAIPGSSDSMTLGAGGSAGSLEGLLSTLRLAFATEEVLLCLDLDWDSATDARIEDLTSDLPMRWAIALPTATPASLRPLAGRAPLGGALADVLQTRPAGRQTLTLELLLDQVVETLEAPAAYSPVVIGRYNPNITMVEFE